MASNLGGSDIGRGRGASGSGLHHAPGGGFRNPWPGAPPPGHVSLRNYMRAHRGLRPFPVDLPASSFAMVSPSIASREADGSLSITWLGHATLLVQAGDMNILTDPVWGPRASPLPFAGPQRHTPPPLPLHLLPPIDAVLISHNHYDHLESRTIRVLARARPEIEWLVPLGLGSFVRARGAARVHELDWWESRDINGATFAATPAQHSSARAIFDHFRTLWCGWTIRRHEHRIYFAGDTAYFPEFSVIGARHGPFDVALLPIGAYEPRPFMQYLHMNPEDSVQAFQDLHSRIESAKRPVMVPIHWGTYKMTIEALHEPPRRLETAWRDSALPPELLRILPLGGTFRC